MKKDRCEFYKCFSFLSTTILFFLFSFTNLYAQSLEIAELAVHAGQFDRNNTPVNASLEGVPLGLQTGYELQLYERVDGKQKPVASQLDSDGQEKTLRWILSGKTPAGTKRNFVLKREKGSDDAEEVEETVHFTDNGKSLTLNIADKSVLSYRYAPKAAPEGVSDLYQRSGYIHPLWSPEG